MDKEALIQTLVYMGIIDKKVIRAIKSVQRQNFVVDENEAYLNHALPIGHGQTISQPYTVAFMLELLDVQSDQTVLEIGSGSGYNAAVMSELVGKNGKIISMELIPELVELSKENLATAGISNVLVIEGDGSRGYKKFAPYDRIIITAACPFEPNYLLSQLKPQGIIVAPVGNQTVQSMTRIKKTKQGMIIDEYGSFMFVPLKGKHGFN